MSYIRCLSNPEGFYIWDDGPNVYINTKDDPNDITIPRDIFDTIIKLYVQDKRGSDVYEYKGCKFEYKEVAPFTTTMHGSFGTYKWVLTYNDYKVEMWESTWSHLILNNMRFHCTNKEIISFVRLHPPE